MSCEEIQQPPTTLLPKTLLIACGALAREILSLKAREGWQHMELICLPAKLHNRPQKIPALVREKIQQNRHAYDRILVLYGDCGSGGLLDKMLKEEGVERIPGPHCYAFFQGVEAFNAHADADPFCFYLTDYLVRHFDSLIWRGLGLDRHPELLADYFGHYRRLVYLSQTDDPTLRQQAAAAARRLGLDYCHQHVGFGDMQHFLTSAA